MNLLKRKKTKNLVEEIPTNTSKTLEFHAQVVDGINLWTVNLNPSYSTNQQTNKYVEKDVDGIKVWTIDLTQPSLEVLEVLENKESEINQDVEDVVVSNEIKKSLKKDNDSEYAVEMTNITKTFLNGKVVANDGVHLRVKKNEVHAIIGENGAGKSTLMSMLFGIYAPDAGEIRINGS